MKKKDKVYYARIIPNLNIFNVCELTIRNVCDTWFVGIDKFDKHAYLFNNEDIGIIIFENRDEALNRVKLAEERKLEKETNTSIKNNV